MNPQLHQTLTLCGKQLVRKCHIQCCFKTRCYPIGGTVMNKSCGLLIDFHQFKQIWPLPSLSKLIRLVQIQTNVPVVYLCVTGNIKERQNVRNFPYPCCNRLSRKPNFGHLYLYNWIFKYPENILNECSPYNRCRTKI